MHLRASEPDTGVSIEMTPMIDIVFDDFIFVDPPCQGLEGISGRPLPPVCPLVPFVFLFIVVFLVMIYMDVVPINVD